MPNLNWCSAGQCQSLRGGVHSFRTAGLRLTADFDCSATKVRSGPGCKSETEVEPLLLCRWHGRAGSTTPHCRRCGLMRLHWWMRLVSVTTFSTGTDACLNDGSSLMLHCITTAAAVSPTLDRQLGSFRRSTSCTLVADSHACPRCRPGPTWVARSLIDAWDDPGRC